MSRAKRLSAARRRAEDRLAGRRLHQMALAAAIAMGARPSHLLPCGCLPNDAGAHRVGCPDHPEGVHGNA